MHIVVADQQRLQERNWDERAQPECETCTASVGVTRKKRGGFADSELEERRCCERRCGGRGTCTYSAAMSGCGILMPYNVARAVVSNEKRGPFANTPDCGPGELSTEYRYLAEQ